MSYKSRIKLSKWVSNRKQNSLSQCTECVSRHESDVSRPPSSIFADDPAHMKQINLLVQSQQWKH